LSRNADAVFEQSDHRCCAPAVVEQPEDGGNAIKSRSSLKSTAFTGPLRLPPVDLLGSRQGNMALPARGQRLAQVRAQHPSRSRLNSLHDYGTNLYLAVPAKNWSGGRSSAPAHRRR